jgi:type VI secretion system protein
MALSLRPDEEPPRTGHDVARFLSCVEDILRASAKAFVELQRGQEQFGHEMGVRTLKEFTALHAAGTPDSVLRYLLDWQSGGPHRTQELVGAYADLMIHQVALLNGVMEGVRALLARLAPAEIERGVTAAWPTRTAAVWKAYVERYRRLAGDDKTVTEIVFGPEFARAYAEVGGEGG